MIEKVADSASIVVIGSFNPGIFHPYWFEKQGLLPETETNNAIIEVVSNSLAIFTMSWVRIEVLSDKFVARTTDESKFGPLKDLVLGIFRLLEFTPVTQLGLNRDMQFKLPDENTWHTIGHTLVPKNIWGNYLKNTGMKLLTVESMRDDDLDGIFNITVKPVLIPPLPMKEWLVEFAVNDHFDLGDKKTASDAYDIISKCWDNSLARAHKIAFGVITDSSKSK